MQNNKLIKLLKAFDKYEIKKFDAFVSSPFFNKNKRIVKLFRIIKKSYPDFKGEKLKKERIYKELFFNEEFSNEKFLLEISYLNRLAEKFMSVNNVLETPLEMEINLLDSLKKRDLDHLVNLAIAKNRKNKYLKKYRCSRSYYYNYVEHKIIREQQVNVASLVKPANDLYLNDSILVYYFNEILSEYISNFEYKSFLKDNENNNIGLLNYVTKAIESRLGFYKKYSQLYIYYQIVAGLNKQPNCLSADEILSLISSRKEQFTQIAFKEVILNYISYLKNQVAFQNVTSKKFKDFQNKIWNYFIQNKYFMLNNVMDPKIFYFVSIFALTAREMEWASNFINNYQQFLPEYKRKMVLNHVYIFFSGVKKDFKNVIKLIHQVSLYTLRDKIDSRLLLIRSYYELNDFLSFFRVCENTKNFIYRQNKLNPKVQKAILIHIKYFEEIGKLKSGYGTNSKVSNMIYVELLNKINLEIIIYRRITLISTLNHLLDESKNQQKNKIYTETQVSGR